MSTCDKIITILGISLCIIMIILTYNYENRK